ncbi:MAG TPA: hypothetical protein PLV66_09695 [Thermoanaerobaculales bacterium]|nr:hypothetical protein [Thermoanaerobaculales bacterium]
MRTISTSMAIVASLGALLVVSVQPAVAQAMKLAAESLEVPSDDEPRPLHKLYYGGRTWIVHFTEVALHRESEPGADPVRAQWTFTGHSTRPKPARAQLMLTLLDEDGATVATLKKSFLVKSGGDPRPYSVEMEIPAADWARVEGVKIQGNFFVGS